MDQVLSSLIPSQRIGQDGFQWWVGQIEGTAADEQNNKGGYRFKVRIVGDHPGDPEILGTDDLPWASVMMPVTVPFIPGNGGGAHPQLEIGCWVMGFYIDTEKQKPIIMGSIGQTPGATKVFLERTPETPPFTTAVGQINAQKDGPPKQKGTDKNTATGGLSDGTKDGEDNQRVTTPAAKLAPLKNNTPQSEDWCQSIAEKCDNEDMMSQMTNIMGEFLYQVQANGGNVGTYLVNEASGGFYDGINVARGYVNKAMTVVNEFVARVKGFVIESISNAVKDLIKAILRPDDTGNALTPVTEFFNNMLKQLGCSIADLGDRLEAWLTNVLMSLIQQIYQSVACQVDALVNGIMSKINSLMNELLSKILGPLQSILGAIAAPLDILGGAINKVLSLLGITCSGPDRTCSEYKQICTNGGEEPKEEGDFLDGLLDSIDNLFPSTGADYTQYVCGDAFKGRNLNITTVGFTGGVPKGGTYNGMIPEPEPADPDKNNGVKQDKRIVYDIDNVTVAEGDIARFRITRSGYREVSSSVTFKTLKYKGTAEENSDYIPVDDIVGFAPGETFKDVQVRTLTSLEREQDEEFFVLIKKNTPEAGSDVQSKFKKNLATCTITEKEFNDGRSPWRGPSRNPEYDLSEEFPEEVTGPPTDIITVPEGQEPVDDDGDGIDDNTGTSLDPQVSVTADRGTCPEGEFIRYSIFTRNIDNGTRLYYQLTGNGITADDIIGGQTNGSFVINNNQGSATVGIEEDGVVEDAEVLRFTVNGTGAFVDVVITTASDTDDFDEGLGDDPSTVIDEFVLPVVNTPDIITDENGGIIDVPISIPGSPWAEPPYVFIVGEGIGATGTALLDQDGFLTEIRVKSPGYGYKKNLQKDNNKRCIIDSYTVIRPGASYTSQPTIYVNGVKDAAEAIIDPETGFLIGARPLDKTTTYDAFPEIVIVGGGGYGAKLLPSLICLDTASLASIGSTKIGTGRYVDCP